MADESLSVQFSADQIDRLLKCAVCLDRFNTPKLLPCQHTFCQSPCLEGLVQRHARILKCPECRAEHFLPLDGVAGLPNNRTILNFLDLAGTAGSTETGYITRCQVFYILKSHNVEHIVLPYVCLSVSISYFYC